MNCGRKRKEGLFFLLPIYICMYLSLPQVIVFAHSSPKKSKPYTKLFIDNLIAEVSSGLLGSPLKFYSYMQSSITGTQTFPSPNTEDQRSCFTSVMVILGTVPFSECLSTPLADPTLLSFHKAFALGVCIKGLKPTPAIMHDYYDCASWSLRSWQLQRRKPNLILVCPLYG